MKRLAAILVLTAGCTPSQLAAYQAHLEQRQAHTYTLRSSAYCLTGPMANGQRAHRGAVAANRFPLGTRLRIPNGPAGDVEYVVKDRHAPGSTELDFALPASCTEARRWGRRNVVVEVVG